MQYLFRAYFADGSLYDQTPQDEALIAPSGSSYTDVLHLIGQGKQLVCFALTRDGVPVAAVWLEDGHFELGGNEFWIGPDHPGPRELVYHRIVTRQRQVDVDAMTLEELGEWRETTQVRFVIGWEADGHQHTIGLDAA